MTRQHRLASILTALDAMLVVSLAALTDYSDTLRQDTDVRLHDNLRHNKIAHLVSHRQQGPSALQEFVEVEEMRRSGQIEK